MPPNWRNESLKSTGQLLDSATLLISLGIDATRFVPDEIIQLYHLLQIAWFAQAAWKWFPQGKPWFDGIFAKSGGVLAKLQQKL